MFRQMMITTQKSRRGERGFSVIEMSVVLLIIAIVAAFVVPKVVAYMRDYRLGVGARNVATALKRARYLATSNNTRAGVLVSETQKVEIKQFDPTGNAEPKTMGTIQMPEGITISEDAPREVSFDGRGLVTPLPTQSQTFRVNGANGYYMIVTVSPTGQVMLSDATRDDSF